MMALGSRRSVITGLGVLSPFGTDLESFWSALLSGNSGIRRIDLFDPSALPCPIAGTIPDFDAKKIVPKDLRKTLRVMARTVQIGVAAAQLAAENARFEKGKIDPFRVGVEFGCVMVASDLEDLARGAITATKRDPHAVNMEAWGEKGLSEVPPLWMLKYLPNMPACHVSVVFDAQGPNNTITAGDAAAMLALGEAYRIIERNAADAFFVGGCDSKLNPLSMTRHSTFQPLTRRISEPERAARPFDRDRDGIVLSESGTVLLLEELEVAKQRGAKILAELTGFASGFDRNREGSVLASVIRAALREANITPPDVDHVNACAGGSVELDAFEARAIKEVFGDSTPVFAPKGHIGASGAASGLTEAAATILALERGELPGTLNCEHPEFAINVRRGVPRKVEKPHAVKISYTDLGQCAVAVFKKWTES